MTLTEFYATLAGMTAQEKREVLGRLSRPEQCEDSVTGSRIGSHSADDFSILGHDVQPIQDE